MKKLLCIIGIIFATTMSTTAFAEMFSFQSVLGVNDISDIQSAVIVGDNGKCADIEQEDLQQWLNVYWNFQGYEPVILPQSNNGYYYIKLWNKDKTKSYVVNANSGILVGRYGEPSKSHGEVKENYLWYFPYIGNARNALYTENSILQTKYLYEGYNLRDVTSDDVAVVPEDNIFSSDGASDWAKEEMQKAAACNLLPVDFTNEYTRSITRKEFCDLIYRLTATKFNPIADSRKGQQDAIKQVIAERQLEEKISEVSYSDCDDEKIKFLSGAGIIYGMDNGTFAPDDNITREQAAAILYRTAEFLGNKTIVEPNGTTFYDENLISDWARESVSIMNSMKIMEGVSDNEFAPKGNYTVEQAVATMVRLYNCY